MFVPSRAPPQARIKRARFRYPRAEERALINLFPSVFLTLSRRRVSFSRDGTAEVRSFYELVRSPGRRFFLTRTVKNVEGRRTRF